MLHVACCVSFPWFRSPVVLWSRGLSSCMLRVAVAVALRSPWSVVPWSPGPAVRWSLCSMLHVAFRFRGPVVLVHQVTPFVAPYIVETQINAPRMLQLHVTFWSSSPSAMSRGTSHAIGLIRRYACYALVLGASASDYLGSLPSQPRITSDYLGRSVQKSEVIRTNPR